MRFRSFADERLQRHGPAGDLSAQALRDGDRRLHSYLPVRSIGIAVDFQPKNRSDIRFAGLIDTTDDEFDAIRDGINGKLERVLTAILSGERPEAVYELWRELTADEVAAAERRHTRGRYSPDPCHGMWLTTSRRAVASDDDPRRRPRQQSATSYTSPCTCPPTGSARWQVLLASLARALVEPAARVARDARPESVDVKALARLLPQVTFSRRADPWARVQSCAAATGARWHRARLDLLVLTELLPSVDRVVVLPVDALATADVGGAATTSTSAATCSRRRRSSAPRGRAASAPFTAPGCDSGPRPRSATELRRRAYARHAFDFDAFTNDVLVLDLARARSEAFAEEYLPYVEEFGLNLRDVLHFAVGPRPGRRPRALGLRADALGCGPTWARALGRPGQAVGRRLHRGAGALAGGRRSAPGMPWTAERHAVDHTLTMCRRGAPDGRVRRPGAWPGTRRRPSDIRTSRSSRR